VTVCHFPLHDPRLLDFCQQQLYLFLRTLNFDGCWRLQSFRMLTSLGSQPNAG
jgi:hypothetical protein